MLFLSIDTSGKFGGITLAEGDANSFRIVASAPIEGGAFSAQLIPTLAVLLRQHGAGPQELGGFVAVSGPGSFTGLRVGLSAVKGLAEVLEKEIATVSLLEALAIASAHPGRIAAALDANRGEVFFGLYEVEGERASKITEELLSHSEFVTAIKKEKPARTISSDSSIIEIAGSAGIEVLSAARPDSTTAARIGLKKLLAGETIGVEELDANYIRRSDAELLHR
jgi:tRNA threonylcarbamoyladenosine biosynthesis protein TsaB